MKRIEQYRWRVLWLEKWKTTRYHATEEEIRVEHPEAVALLDTLIVRDVPETDEERAEVLGRSGYGPGFVPKLPGEG